MQGRNGRTAIIGLVLLALLDYIPSAAALSETIQYGHILSGASKVSGDVYVLFGSPKEQAFLQGFAIAPNKAKFICDNTVALGNSQHASIVDDGTFTWSVPPSKSWPVNETIVACGSVWFKQRYQDEDIDVAFRFAAWGSAAAYEGLREEIPAPVIAYVDYCPRDKGCNGLPEHPAPEMPVHSVTVSGALSITDCCNDFLPIALNAGTIVVVLDVDDEGKNFNASFHNACDSPPLDEKAVFQAEADGKREFGVNVKFQGSGIPATVYLCGTVDRCSGYNVDHCNMRPSGGNVSLQQRIRLFPGKDVDLGFHKNFRSE